MSRDIDERVAFEVMGWTRWVGPTGFNCTGEPGGGHRDIPHYSTDPAAAMQVVERMLPEFAMCMHVTGEVFGKSRKGNPVGGWCVCFGFPEEDENWVNNCETFPMAVCLAALYAVEHTPKRAEEGSNP